MNNSTEHSQRIKKFHVFYGVRNFINQFTGTRHLPLSWFRLIQSHFWRSILILSSRLFIGLRNDSFIPGFPIKTRDAPLIFSMRATCPAHPTLLYLIPPVIFGEGYSLLHSPLTSFLLGPGAFRTPSASILPQHERPSKITFLYIFLIFIILDSKIKDKSFCTE